MNKDSGGNVWDKLVMSGADALNPLNILWTILKFIFFGLMIGSGYLIMNLDKVFNSDHSNVLSYLKALGGALWSGVFLGLSTTWDTLVRVVSGDIGRNYATIGISIFILVFATFTIHQVIRLLFNIFDLRKGRATPVVVTLFVSFLVVLLLIAPISYMGLKGQTITSHLEDDSGFVDNVLGVNETSVNGSSVNESVGDYGFIDLYNSIGGD